MLRRLYRRYVHAPALDRAIYRFLDTCADAYSRLRRYSFPKNYIRRWKLDMLRGRYEQETYALFREIIVPGAVVVDIGAHIGYYTRLAAKLAGGRGRVYAFEADPENFALLQKNTAHLRNVERVRLAVSDKDGTIDFYHYDDKSGAHSTLPNVPLDFHKRKITVVATTLDAWLGERNVPRVDVIKMDIEGGESAALRGMARTLAQTRVLITEFAPAWIEASGSSPRAFLTSLEAYGFSVNAITERGLISFSPVQDGRFAKLLPTPKDGSHASEFLNLYCVKK